MNKQLYIPTLLKVGFQKRDDTYTGKLGYVTYYDQKNVLRKEKSWKDWCSKKLGSQEFENKPTEGFVINRNGGGIAESWGDWNDTRHEFVRVYDPRGFEFEIRIPNLLFILSESNSIKGKGLEGEFVYAWQGTQLILVPTSSQQYKNSLEFTALQGKKLDKKELTPGCIYRTKKQKDLIYMGRFDWYEFGYNTKKNAEEANTYGLNTKKEHVFIYMGGKKPEVGTLQLKNIASKISDTPVENFADLMTRVAKDKHIAKPETLVAKPAKLALKTKWGYPDVVGGSYRLINGKYVNHSLSAIDYSSKKAKALTCHASGYILSFNEQNELLVETSPYLYREREKRYTLEELQELEFFDLYVKLENGTSVKVDNYVNSYDNTDLNNIYDDNEFDD
jgi:hypothetical protein